MAEENQFPATSRSRTSKHTRLKWLLFILLNVVFVTFGQTSAVLLGRFYYKQGGNSVFMATLVQSSGFPILFIPLLLFPNTKSTISPSPNPNPPPKKHVLCIYIALGFLTAGDNLLFSIGLLYLSASTYSLICTTQLIFNVVFSYFLSSQKPTPLIINSVGIVTFSAALLAVNQSKDTPENVTKIGYIIGFLCTLSASALYSLILSLTQLSFTKFLKKETFYVVIEMQIWVSVGATVLSILGLFISGQWRNVNPEMAVFVTGQNSYVMTLLWTAVCWQLCSVGVVGLIFLVSSLFSNICSSVALAFAPVVSVVVFHDKMDGVKIIAMLQAFLGMGSYAYQRLLDDRLRVGSRETTTVSGEGVGSDV